MEEGEYIVITFKFAGLSIQKAVRAFLLDQRYRIAALHPASDFFAPSGKGCEEEDTVYCLSEIEVDDIKSGTVEECCQEVGWDSTTVFSEDNCKWRWLRFYVSNTAGERRLMARVVSVKKERLYEGPAGNDRVATTWEATVFWEKTFWVWDGDNLKVC